MRGSGSGNSLTQTQGPPTSKGLPLLIHPSCMLAHQSRSSLPYCLAQTRGTRRELSTCRRATRGIHTAHTPLHRVTGAHSMTLFSAFVFMTCRFSNMFAAKCSPPWCLLSCGSHISPFSRTTWALRGLVFPLHFLSMLVCSISCSFFHC